MSRVLFLSGEYPPMRGGIGDYTARLRASLAETGWESWVLTSAAARGEDRQVLPWVERWDWSLAGQVREVAAEIGAELIHLQYQAGAFAMHPALNLLPLALARRGGPPLVTTFHDLLPPYLFPKAGRLRGGAIQLLARGSRALVVTNEADRRRLARSRRLARRLARIPIGSNLPEAPPRDRAATRERLGIPPGPALGFFGFLTADKGFELLLAAIHRLPEPRPALVVLGGGLGATDAANGPYLTQLLAAQQHGEDRVIWTGHLPPAEAAAALAALDLVVLPFARGASLRRGTLIAALRAGLPVITTDPAPGESLEPFAGGRSLWLVPQHDPDALASAIRTLLADDVLRERLGRQAREESAPFDWREIAARHVALYERLPR